MRSNRIFLFIIIIFFSFFLTSYLISQTNWSLLNLSKPLTSIHFINENSGYVFGSNVRFNTSNGGVKWKYSANIPNIGLFPDNSVFFVDNLNGWAAQYNWDLFKTSDGGISWMNVPIGLIVHTYSVFFNGSDGWSWGTDDKNILKSNNSGNSWYRVTTGFDKNISSLWFTDVNTGFATFSFSWSNVDSFAVTSNGGLNWSKKMIAQHHGPLKVFFADHTYGWMICMGNYMNRTTDGGHNWQGYYVPMAYPNNIFFQDSSTGFVLEDKKIWKSIDGGISWQLKKIVQGSLVDINFSNTNNGFAVGNEGVIYHSSDTGNNWSKDTTVFPNEDIISVSFVNHNTGWACSPLKIYKTINGGFNWSTNFINSGFYLTKIYNVNKDLIFASGKDGKILRSSNGGINWSSEILNLQGYNFNSLYFTDSNIGWIAGNGGTLYKTINGGLNWSISNTNTTKNLNSIIALNQNECYSVGDSGILLKSGDGGINWSQTILNDKTLKSINFINDSTGFIISNKSYYLWFNNTYESKLFMTTDKGTNWFQVYTRSDVNHNTFLNSISFSDPLHGVATGNGNVILRTSNGGQNWSEYFINVENVNFFDVNYINNIGFIVGSNGCLLTTDNNSTSINSSLNILPENFYVFQNYPNPFNPVTKIRYSLSKNILVNIKIYDITGKEVAELLNELKSPGIHEIVFDANSYKLSSGIYFYVFNAGNFTETKKMAVVK